MNYGTPNANTPNLNQFQLGYQQGLPDANLPRAPDATAGTGAQGGGPMGNMRPEDVQAFMQMAATKPQEQEIAQQRKLADFLRGNASKGLQGTQAGRMFVAPHWTQLVGNIGQNLAAGGLDEQAQQGGLNLAKTQGQIAKDYLAGIKGLPMGGTPPPANPYVQGAGADAGGGGGFMDYFKRFWPMSSGGGS